LKFDFEFTVEDHIGAVAVQTSPGLLLGANWDTEWVYVWDLKGNLQRTLRGRAVADRGLGLSADSQGRDGLAVQDWKLVGGRLYASGLGRASNLPGSGRSQLFIFTNFLRTDFQSFELSLPGHGQTELAREAMAVTDGWIYFLPEDLSSSNRLFRLRQTE
jgi:hypothetical protein